MTKDNNKPHVWTVRQLREALAQFPDDLPLAVCAPVDDDTYVTFAITGGPSYQMADWGDGRGLVADERYVAVDAFAELRVLRSGLEIRSCDTSDDLI